MSKISRDKIYINQGNADVLNLINKNLGNVLDVGCGGGSLAKILKTKGFITDGITISEIESASASSFLRNVYIYNLENGLPDELKTQTYDVIVCSHVLEHIAYPEKLMKDLDLVLKHDGILIIALPNIMHYKSRIELIRGNFNYKEMGIWDYTHFRWYTFSSAKKLLESFGFSVEIATVTGKLPFLSVFNKIIPKKLQVKLFRFLTRISKGFFGYQLLYRATKGIKLSDKNEADSK